MANRGNANPNSLTYYLAQAYLSPLLVKETAPPVHHIAPPWPRMTELFCGPAYNRQVRQVSEIPTRAVENAVRIYLIGFENRIKVDWENASLTMPCPGMKRLDNASLARLLVENEHDYMHSVQYFMLSTAAEAIRSIERRPFDDDELKFIRYRLEGIATSRKICTLYMFGEPVPPTGITRPGIVILSVPPWTFGAGDFMQFTTRRRFNPGELDREAHNAPAPWNNAMKLWATLYDTCKVSGYRWFVVTTYNHWVFGNWSLDWTAVEITTALPFDKTRAVTLVELLVFWVQSAREKVRYWHLPGSAD